MAAVGAERGGDVKRVVLHEGIAGGIPGSVASGLKGGSQTTVGERRGIGFAFDQLFAGKLHDDPSVWSGRDKTVVLFGSNACHGLEPVGKMSGSQRNRPLLHGIGHRVGHSGLKLFPLIDCLLQGVIDIGRESGLHHSVVEHHASEQFRYVHHFSHPFR